MQRDKDKNLGPDRILELRPIEGEKAKTSTGLVDTRLFQGKNKLHGVMDPTGLWTFKYEVGGLPPALQQSFTSFGKLKDHAVKYFKSRNVEVVEVIG